MPLLPAGSYVVTASRAGFRSSRRDGIRLDVDEKARVDFALDIGPIEQLVSVVGDVSQAQTGTSASEQLVGSEFVRGLPLNGRDFLQLGGTVRSSGSKLSAGCRAGTT